MRVTIKSLRTGILLLAGLLVLALVSFFVYAKFQMRRFGKDLPGKLGLQIQQSANGFTISKTDKNGKVILTVHAAKEVQYKDGRASLHDTSITLYSPDGTRADRIYGSDFDYDQSTQVATAKGEVQIDLASPAAKSKEPRRLGARGFERADDSCEDQRPDLRPEDRRSHHAGCSRISPAESGGNCHRCDLRLAVGHPDTRSRRGNHLRDRRCAASRPCRACAVSARQPPGILAESHNGV